MKDCKNCWHNYHYKTPQEGYNYPQKECPFKEDKDCNNFEQKEYYGN